MNLKITVRKTHPINTGDTTEFTVDLRKRIATKKFIMK